MKRLSDNLNVYTDFVTGSLIVKQQTIDSQVKDIDDRPIPGLYAAGEASGFGGGGMHGYRSLEGTFLGGCLFSGRIAGRAAANAVG